MIPAITRRTVLGGLAASAVLPAHGDEAWPGRSITLIHGVAPGSPSDAVARVLADGLSERIGQQIIVDPRPGAAGRVAAGQVARATPDGHTLMVIPAGHAISAALYKELPYRPIADFTTVSLLSEIPLIVVTSADSSVHTLNDLIAIGRERAKPLLFGSAGNGSLQHLAGELLSNTVNLTFQHVPYRGSAQPITDLIAKRIDFIVDIPTAQMRAIRSGRVRALSVTSAKRFFRLPDVPTTAEAGLPNYAFTAWQGLVGPAGMPQPLVERINLAVAAAFSDPAIVERMRSLGHEPALSSPEELKTRLTADVEKWSKLVETASLDRI